MNILLVFTQDIYGGALWQINNGSQVKLFQNQALMKPLMNKVTMAEACTLKKAKDFLQLNTLAVITVNQKSRKNENPCIRVFIFLLDKPTLNYV